MKALRADGTRQQAPCFHCACGEDSEHVLVDHATITARLCHACFGTYLEANVPGSHIGKFFTPPTVFDPAAGSGGYLAAIVTNPPFEVQS